MENSLFKLLYFIFLEDKRCLFEYHEFARAFQWKSIVTKSCSREFEPIAKNCLFKWLRWTFNQCDTATFNDEVKLMKEALLDEAV
jgi:hypothetical protein